MSNLVLYRKYRPQTFQEVVGQEHVKQTLLNALKEQRVAHAYLFSGPRGCGKTTMARILAKAVNCEDKTSAEPCNKCSSCVDIMSNRAVDIIEIDAASHRGIDEVRELREGVKFGPTKGNYKVFILDEAHQLTSGASNAFLKTLEEAPSHAIFILATTEAEKMITTIISRCQRFDFRKITVPETVERLKMIAKKEKVQLEDDAFKMIAAASGGALRDAESLLSQVFSLAGKGEKIKKDDVKNLLGLVEREVVSGFLTAVFENKPVDGLEVIEKAMDQGVSPEAFHENLMHYLREIMILKILVENDADDKSSSVTESLIAKLTQEEIKEMKDVAGQIGFGKLKELIDIFHAAGERIRFSPIPQLPLEVALAEAIRVLQEK